MCVPGSVHVFALECVFVCVKVNGLCSLMLPSLLGIPLPLTPPLLCSKLQGYGSPALSAFSLYLNSLIVYGL